MYEKSRYSSLMLIAGLSLVSRIYNLEALVMKSNHQPQRLSNINPMQKDAPFVAIGDDGPSTGLANSNDLLIMVPSNLNLTTDLNDPKSNLFKLNPDVLIEKLERENSADGSESESKFSKANPREARRMNFLKGIWNKPKVSPLYLVNGTVCRFVNSSPICTTLTTTGILPNNNNNNINNGLNPNIFNNQDNPNNQNNQNVRNQNNGNNNQRPSALMDDESQDINVESINESSVEGNSTSGNKAPSQASVSQSGSRPVNVNRRPMNVLNIRRPMRKSQA